MAEELTKKFHCTNFIAYQMGVKGKCLYVERVKKLVTVLIQTEHYYLLPTNKRLERSHPGMQTHLVQHPASYLNRTTRIRHHFL